MGSLAAEEGLPRLQQFLRVRPGRVEGIAIYLINLESIMLEDLIPNLSWPDHSTTAEDVLHASDLDVVDLLAAFTVQAEVQLKTAEHWLFVDLRVFQLQLGQLRPEPGLKLGRSGCVELLKGRVRDVEAVACEFQVFFEGSGQFANALAAFGALHTKFCEVFFQGRRQADRVSQYSQVVSDDVEVVLVFASKQFRIVGFQELVECFQELRVLALGADHKLYGLDDGVCFSHFSAHQVGPDEACVELSVDSAFQRVKIDQTFKTNRVDGWFCRYYMSFHEFCDACLIGHAESASFVQPNSSRQVFSQEVAHVLFRIILVKSAFAYHKWCQHCRLYLLQVVYASCPREIPVKSLDPSLLSQVLINQAI